MITLYTVITAGKDEPIKQDYPCVQFIDAYDKFKDPRRNSRIQKIMPHKYFDSEYTIYLDGNRKLIMPPEEIIERYMKGFDIAMFKHSTRDCIYDEALTVAKLKLDDPEIIIEQAKYYEDHEYAKHKGLCEAGFMVRRNTRKVQAFNEAWWADYCRFSRRDQLSLMPALDKIGLVVNALPFNYEQNDKGEWTRGGIVQVMADHNNLEGNHNNPNK